MLRTGRKDLAAATLVLDALKATAATCRGVQSVSASRPMLAGAAGAFFGHLYPVWLRFRGGKGVATFLGGLIGACWPAALGFALVWLAVAAMTRYSSAAALAASVATPAADARVRRSTESQSSSPLLAALLWVRHSANIARLLAGTETKIGKKG